MKERKRGRKEIKEDGIKERTNEVKTSMNNHVSQCPVNTAMQQHIRTAASRWSYAYDKSVRDTVSVQTTSRHNPKL